MGSQPPPAGDVPGPAPRGPEGTPWITLFVATRLVATAVAVGLLLFHHISDRDQYLAPVALAYGAGSTFVLVRSRRLQRSPWAWAADAVIVLLLIIGGGEWRSPFYLLGLTTLVLPASTLPFTQALGAGAAFTLGYVASAVVVGLDPQALRSSARLESFVTHTMVPMLVTASLAYATTLIGRLQREQERSARLAVESERRRIAWELHDSAKQRIQAAHLMLTASRGLRSREQRGALVDQALTELRHASTDMDESLTELRSPLLDGRALPGALRDRAADLAVATPGRITVSGEAGELPSFIAAHAYRIATEAMSNAVRHAQADEVAVRIARTQERLTVTVSDDGRGLPGILRSEGSGLRAMEARAEALGADLSIAPGDPAGTVVRLDVPLTSVVGARA